MYLCDLIFFYDVLFIFILIFDFLCVVYFDGWVCILILYVFGDDLNGYELVSECWFFVYIVSY